MTETIKRSIRFYDLRTSSYRTCDVVLTLDYDKLFPVLGAKAANNAGKKCRAMKGVIKATASNIRN